MNKKSQCIAEILFYFILSEGAVVAMSGGHGSCWWVNIAPGLICRTHESDANADDSSCVVECFDLSLSDWGCALGGGAQREAQWQRGKQEYSVRINSARLENMYIGVARTTHCIDAHICGETHTSWSLYPFDGDVSHASKSFRFWDKPIVQGDIVRVILDFDERNLSFAINGSESKVAFSDLDVSEPLVPCVTLALNSLSVALIDCTRADHGAIPQ